MSFLRGANRTAVVMCIEIALMRKGNVNYSLVLSKLHSLYNCSIYDCIDNQISLKTVLKQVYTNDYDSVLDDIGKEMIVMDMGELKLEFSQIMRSNS